MEGHLSAWHEVWGSLGLLPLPFLLFPLGGWRVNQANARRVPYY